MPRHSKTQSGFTLIELIIALSIASIVIAMAYNSMARLSQSNKQLREHLTEEQNLWRTHQVLSQIFDHAEVVESQRDLIILEVTTAPLDWLKEVKKIQLTLSNTSTSQETSLLAQLDDEVSTNLLIKELVDARFSLSNNNSVNGSLITFEFMHNKRRHQWEFTAQ